MFAKGAIRVFKVPGNNGSSKFTIKASFLNIIFLRWSENPPNRPISMSVTNILCDMGNLYYCQVSYVFDAVRTGISRANNGNSSCRRNEAASRIGAMRFRLRFRMGAVISVANMIHGRAAYQLSPISRKIWAAVGECPTETPSHIDWADSIRSLPVCFGRTLISRLRKNAAAPFVQRKRRGSHAKEVSTFRLRIGLCLGGMLTKNIRCLRIKKAIMVNNTNISFVESDYHIQEAWLRN